MSEAPLWLALLVFLLPLPLSFVLAAPLVFSGRARRGRLYIIIGALLSFLGLVMSLLAWCTSTLGALS